jgi:hypothetical protein
MNIILFASPESLKEFYLFDDNLEEGYIVPNIKKCMDFIIRPLMGKTLYDELYEQVNTDTVTEQNQTILNDYIEPIIGWYVQSEIVYSTAYKLKNEGLESGTDKFNELVRISKKYLYDSQQYQTIFKEYMCDNSLSISPEKDTYKYGIYLGRS